jgi:hypothetical protein
MWPGQATAWAVAVLGIALAFYAFGLTRNRASFRARLMGPLTILAAAGWLGDAATEGISRPVGGVWFVAGGTLAMAWSMRLHSRAATEDGGLGQFFTAASEHTSTPGTKLRVTDRQPHKITAIARHRPGVTTADLQKDKGSYESAMDIPGGAMTVTEHPRTARASKVNFTNPRTLETSRLWQGASRPGASAADPIRIGRFADLAPWEFSIFPRDLPGFQLLIMGMTGSAKTTGVGYCMLAELMTRRDVAIIGMDPTKGLQFLGAMRPALHHLAIDMKDVRRKLWQLDGLTRARTDYLATQGLQKWEEGCGLSALVCWLEEASKVFRMLGDNDVEKWVLPMVLAARSAGIFIVLSLQRASFDQIPPSIRAQLSSICLGVREAKDAEFGLSDEQQDAGCSPGRWRNEKPGMAYCAIPGLPGDEYEFTEARSDYWGSTNAMIAAHAAQWPAEDRPMDPLSLAHLFPPDTPEVSPQAARQRAKPKPRPEPEEADVRHEPPTDEDLDDAPPETGYDDPELWRHDPDEDGPEGMPPGAVDFRFGRDDAPEPTGRIKMTPEAAREALRARVIHWIEQGKTDITKEDLADLTDPHSPTYIDRTPQWLYPAMTALAAEGLIIQHDRPRRWTIRQEAA